MEKSLNRLAKGTVQFKDNEVIYDISFSTSL